MDYPEPIVILSDLHVSARGRWERKLERLAPLWRGAGTVIFNGDTVDWSPKTTPEMTRALGERVAEACRRDGVEPVVLAGNADFAIASRRHVLLNGGRVLVTHGDSLYDGVSPWRPRASRTARLLQGYLSAMPRERRESLEARLEALQLTLEKQYAEFVEGGGREHPIRFQAASFARMLTNPSGFVGLYRALRENPVRGAEFLERYCPAARVLVLGHFHRAGVWRFGERTVINTGHYKYVSHALRVCIEGERVRVERILRRDGRIEPGNVETEFQVSKS